MFCIEYGILFVRSVPRLLTITTWLGGTPAAPPAIGAVRLSARPNKVSSDDRSLSDEANISAVCALFAPIGMFVAGEYLSIAISELNDLSRSRLNSSMTRFDPLSYSIKVKVNDMMKYQ
jgi:hypothetical protein